MERRKVHSPHALQVHRPDLDHSLLLLGFEDAIAAAARHLGHVQELSAIDHMVVWYCVRRYNRACPVAVCHISSEGTYLHAGPRRSR